MRGDVVVDVVVVVAVLGERELGLFICDHFVGAAASGVMSDVAAAAAAAAACSLGRTMQRYAWFTLNHRQWRSLEVRVQG